MAHYQLDAKRLLCPLPVIRTQNKVSQLMTGDHLTVYCTDPGALLDIPAWCRIFGHKVISTEQRDDEIIISLEIV